MSGNPFESGTQGLSGTSRVEIGEFKAGDSSSSVMVDAGSNMEIEGIRTRETRKGNLVGDLITEKRVRMS